MEKAAFKYLIEEVRDGFMVPAHVKQAWAADLSVLEEIDRICCKHNIAYFADWGRLDMVESFLGTMISILS